jgi:glycosyltransferase involved in cell wall biosynthesis
LKIFLNLISVKTGGQIIRASKFIEKIEKDSSKIELVIVKQASVLSNLKNSSKTKIINIDLGNHFSVLKRFFWENFLMHKLIRINSCNIFLTFSHYLPFKKIKIPTIVGVSNLAPFSKIALKEENYYYKFKFWILGKTILSSIIKADLVLTLSLTAKDLMMKLGINEDKIFLNHIGVDSFWSSISQNDDLLKTFCVNKKYFLYVSHFYRYKNHFRLIRAYANLSLEIQNKYNLILIGKPMNPSYFNKIKKLIFDLNLENKVISIPGLARDDLRVFYQNCFLFIFPSLVENCPNILLEAMASGAPIATVNIDPMKEYCLDYAVYFDGTKVESIKNAIIKFIENNNHQKMQKLSLKRSKDFSWDTFVNNIIYRINNI